MAWQPSDEQLETIKTGWTITGQSAGQLAGMFGVSRNVIIGICHRRGWEQPGGSRRIGQKSSARISKPIVKPPAPVVVEKKPDPVFDPKNFVAFDQLGPHHCRYPMDAGGKDGRYCGLQPNGTPYCDAHAKKVYSPTQPPKIRRPR